MIGQRAFVLNDDVIEAALNNTGAKGFVSFKDKEEPSLPTGEEDCLMTPAAKESWMGFSIISLSGQVVKAARRQCSSREKVYGTVIGTMWKQRKRMLFTEDLTQVKIDGWDRRSIWGFSD